MSVEKSVVFTAINKGFMDLVRFFYLVESLQLGTPSTLGWLAIYRIPLLAAPRDLLSCLIDPGTPEPSQLPHQPPEASDIHSETYGSGLPPSVQLAYAFLSYCA